MPIGLDWLYSILPAVNSFIEGVSPYTCQGFYCAPFPFWTFIMLAPFAMLPFWIGRVALFAVSLLAFAYTAIRMGANRWQLIMFLTSSAVVGCLANGNLDWLVTLGLWMPPQLGLFFILMKPQIGVAVAIYWLYASWKTGGVPEVVRVFSPVVHVYLYSFLVYGFWIGKAIGTYANNPDNMSAFPFLIPVGLILLYLSLKQNKESLSLFASPLLSPYVSQFSYSVFLLALLQRPGLFILTWILLWLPVLARLLL